MKNKLFNNWYNWFTLTEWAVVAVLLTACSISWAVTPWAKDCVTWYGAAIPVDKRTPENCVTGRSHWDSTEHTGPVVIPRTANRTTVPATPMTNYSGRTQVITNSGSYLITQQPGTVFILQTAD